MKNLTRLFMIMFALSATTLFYSCQEEVLIDTETADALSEAQHVQDAQTNEKVLTIIDLKEKGSVRFVELEPGEMAVDALVTSADILPEEQISDPIELYTYITNEPAPKVLLDAYAKVKESQALADADPLSDLTEPHYDNSGTRLSGADFQASYCPTGWDYLYCWLNRTGTGSVERKEYSMYTYAHPYNGTISHKFRYKQNFVWHTFVDRSVLQGNVSYIGMWGNNRKREAKVYQAAGDGYHMSIYGTN